MPTSFSFHGVRVSVRLRTADTGGRYALVEMEHRPGAGPALHVHPRGPESFYVLDGVYTFTLGDETRTAGPGEAVSVPPGIPHRYVAGPDGGRALIVVPPDLETYFERVGRLLAAGPVSWDVEAAIAAEHGQDFQDAAGHWTA